MNFINYNPLDAMFSDAFNSTFPLPDVYVRPKSVVTVEDDDFLIHISTGDDGISLTPEEAEQVVAKLGFALQEREQ